MEKMFERKKGEKSMLSKNLTGKNTKKRLIIPVILLIGILCSLFLFYSYNNDSTYKGEVESLILPTISEVSGKIIEADTSLGQTVKKGDIIALIDSTNQTYELSQLELTLQKKKIALADLSVDQEGQANNAALSAQANFNSASIAADKASKDYADARNLFAEGAISSSDLSKAQVSAASTSSLKSAALAQLNNTLSATGQSSSQIDVTILENQISQAKDTLSKYMLTAPCDGTIISKNYNTGSVVSPGYNLADIGSATERYVVFYVPEAQISKIKYNQTVQIEFNGATILSKIKYIDVKNQYTPKDLQTAANKSKTSFKVKALLPSNSDLPPGIRVWVTLSPSR